MRVLETTVTRMTYDADFDRVEASVILIVKPQAGQPARRIRLRTSQPRSGPGKVEDRLARDAIRLATAMNAAGAARRLPAVTSASAAA